MANLRIQSLTVRSSVSIDVKFTHNLSSDIGIENVTIKGITSGVSDLTVLSVTISGAVMTIGVRPMVPRAEYKLILESTELITVKGASGENFFEDGRTNQVFFVGLQEDIPLRDDILADLPPIYNTDSGSLVFDTIDSSAREIDKSSQAVGEVRSANYVSVEVTDESIIRGAGPFDRFANEGVYQILRVGSAQGGTTASATIVFNEFPADPVSLQQIEEEDETVSNVENDDNKFEGLIVTLANRPVIKLLGLQLVRGTQTFDYDIEQYRYGILESKYDGDNAYPALDLEDNQIRLSTSAVGPTFPFPQGSDEMIVTYLYKRVGRDVDPDSVVVSSIVSITRESAPSVSTSFFLDNAPIVTSQNVIPTTGGVTWLDPAVNFDPNSKHPAFVTEIQFNTSNLPRNPGEYAINYNTGQVFVFGVDGTGVDGTTTVPPVANYSYRKTFQEGLDYNFFSDLDEIASLPGRDLRGEPATIAFDYEDTFADGTDFDFLSHIEVIDERVDNRLIETIGLYTEHGPVTEVFRIFNETTGEIYTPTRISGNQVYFSAVNPPELIDITREAARYDQRIQSQIVVTDEVSITGKSFVAFRVELADSKIMSATGGYIGASFNTSLAFSDMDVFVTERFYDSGDTLSENLVRLQQIGDYMADYVNGVVYVAVASGSATDIGDATYRYGKIRTRNDHIIRVTDIYRSSSPLLENSETFTVGVIEDDVVSVIGLEEVGFRTIDSSPIVVVSGTPNTITVEGDVATLRTIFQVTDLLTSASPIDFSDGATVSSSNGSVINLSTSGARVEDDNDGSGLIVQLAGTRKYVEAERISSLHSSGLAQIISGISVNDFSTGENYFSQGSDGYADAVDNRLYLPSSTGATAGTLVTAIYRAQLNGGAAVSVDYSTGDTFVDYTYNRDEILITYEYGNNVLDWSISSALNEGEEYFVTYRYGALRNSLRDNFGVLTGIPEISTIPEELDRETYRNAITGSLQSFLKGPTIPSIEELAEAFTQITPNITESVFLEWILGRDSLHLEEMTLSANSDSELPTFAPGKFGDGILLNTDGQKACIPASSNMRFNEGTWEAFVTPEWNGLDNDATLTFDIKMDGVANPKKIFIGAEGENPSEVPFSLSKDTDGVLGRPSTLHSDTGYFIWFDSTAMKWRLRCRAPISESRLFTGTVVTSGEFHDVKIASTADGYDGYDGYEVNEINDVLKSGNETLSFAFIVDSYDTLNMVFDAYDDYAGGGFAGFDGFDFTSDDLHYFFDTGVEDNKCRMSLFKDGKGFLRYKVYDENNRIKMLSANIRDWEAGETHHLAVSWKLATVEMRDEMHLFIDGVEIPNTFRFRGYLPTTAVASPIYMDEAVETILSASTGPIIGGSDLQTTAGSDIVTSLGSNFSDVVVGSQFFILDDTTDGTATQVSPLAYVRTVIGQNQLQLESTSPGSGTPFNLSTTLTNVKFTVNSQTVSTVSDPQVEDIRVFVIDGYGVETELLSPITPTPDYGFDRINGTDFVQILNGVPLGGTVVVRSYGLTTARCRQLAYIWPDQQTNILRTIMPQPTFVSKVDITALIVRRSLIEIGAFALVATDVGTEIIPLLISNLTFCQPSNDVTGRRFRVSLFGDNLDFGGINQIVFIGDTTDGYGSEALTFTSVGDATTTRYFTSLTDVIASFTPIDISKPVGVIEIREALPLTEPENNGTYADVRLSVQTQTGIDGYTTIGTGRVTDGYARFGAEDIGKIFNITAPGSIAGTYTVLDVPNDPSGTVKDSNAVILNTTWADAYTDVEWNILSTSYADSGFANGLITLEIANSGGQPFLLNSCWYEVDFPTYLTVPWQRIPNELCIGSDKDGHNQADAVIDELRILDELSNDTGLGETAPSSGRSITTDANTIREFEDTTQTLALFHFNGDTTNDASFRTTYEKTFRQSANSVNSNFGQSIIFNTKSSLEVDNTSIFQNNEGTIEFWVSPILDTFNDPTRRFYIDLSPEQVTNATAVSALTVPLPIRARSVSSITIFGSDVNYFTGGSLSVDGLTVTLGQPLPSNVRDVVVTFVPITSQGDRFSIFKNETGGLVLSVTASGTDYQITTPIFWKKNTWHRVFVGWDLNNSDNQDRLIMIVDGIEGGTIRYGTGLLYGTGVVYGQPTVWGSATAGTTASRNILADINLTDTFNTVHIGADFTGQFTALARMDNIRFSSALRTITFLGGEGPGQLIGRDLLFTSNTDAAQPVISDALTRLLLDFDTDQVLNESLATIRDNATGIFDFFVEVIDTFELADTDLAHELITQLINRIKPAHTRAFVSFTK